MELIIIETKMSLTPKKKKNWNSQFELSKDDTSIFLGPSLFPNISRSCNSVRDEGRYSPQFMKSQTLPLKDKSKNEPNPLTTIATTNRIKHLDGPFGISRMKNGNLVVAEWRGNSISLVNERGSVLMTFGRRQLSKESIICNRLSGVSTKNSERHGSSLGELHEPTSIIVTEYNQRLLVVDSMNHRLQAFSCGGDPIGAIGNNGMFNMPYDVCTDSLNRIYVTDTFSHKVLVLTESYLLSNTFGGKGATLGKFNCPLGIACDSEGMIYVCDRDNSRVQKMNCFGRPLLEMKQDHLLYPVKVAVDSSGIVYVTYNYLPEVAMFDGSTGDYIGSFSCQTSSGTGDKLVRPRGILVDDTGQVYVCDVSRNEIWIF